MISVPVECPAAGSRTPEEFPHFHFEKKNKKWVQQLLEIEQNRGYLVERLPFEERWTWSLQWLFVRWIYRYTGCP